MNNKKEIRNKYKTIRKSIPNKKEKSIEIFNRVIENPLFIDANVIAFYNSTEDEVDTKRLIEYSESINKTILLPEVVGLDLIYFAINNQTRYKLSNYGIIEPTNGLVYSPDRIDLVIVPGVAFDKAGNRLGYGGGYYDRFLSYSDLPTIALCFEKQITDELPIENTDQKVDIIVTENQTYLINKETLKKTKIPNK